MRSQEDQRRKQQVELVADAAAYAARFLKSLAAAAFGNICPVAQHPGAYKGHKHQLQQDIGTRDPEKILDPHPGAVLCGKADQVDPDRQTYADNQSALAVDSCYNTRRNAGLPCGPISNPGLSALLAVAEPADTSYLYFLTGDDGVMYYSYTEPEHIQNIQLHCQELCNVSL